MDGRLKRLVVVAAVAIALLLGVLIGVATGVADRVLGGPDPKTIASASLESMRAQNRLIAFVARYVSVTSSEQQRFGGLVRSERTLVLPGDVRYELDLAKLQPNDVTWDASSNTLQVRLPEVEIAGPDVDISAAREFGTGGWVAWSEPKRRPSGIANRLSLARPLSLAALVIDACDASEMLRLAGTTAVVVARFPTKSRDVKEKQRGR